MRRKYQSRPPTAGDMAIFVAPSPNVGKTVKILGTGIQGKLVVLCEEDLISRHGSLLIANHYVTTVPETINHFRVVGQFEHNKKDAEEMFNYWESQARRLN